MTSTQQECPSCHAMVPVCAPYMPWCDRCDWNLQPHDDGHPRTIFESFYARLGQRLLAHELAHGINGDPNRGLFVGTAIQSLARWHRFLHPRPLLEHGVWSFYHLLVLAILTPVMLCLSSLARLGAYVLSHLLYRDAQRAEYLADDLAARVAGTAAVLALLDKLHYAGTFAYVFRTASQRQSTDDIFEELTRQIEQMPQREMERIRRIEQLESSRLDATHPATTYRIANLQAHPVTQPRVILPRGDAAQVDREMEPYRGAMRQRIAARRTWV